jgi:hypothetical protein
MAYNVYATQFYIVGDWPARREEPNAIASRLCRFLDGICNIDATLGSWSIGRHYAPYQSARHHLTALIGRDVKVDEDGNEDVEAGYAVMARSEHPAQRYRVLGTAGSAYNLLLSNQIGFDTDSDNGVDPAIVTHAVMKAVMTELIACWEPLFCLAGSSAYDLKRGDIWYERSCWITYVPPQHAGSVDLVGVPFNERTPDSGLLLSATDQPYDAADPAHVEGTRRNVAATRHLNATLPQY